MDYVFSNKTKKITLGTAVVGVLLFALAVLTDSADYGVIEHGLSQRVWGNLLVNGFFFFSIALAMLFFLALQNLASRITINVYLYFLTRLSLITPFQFIP